MDQPKIYSKNHELQKRDNQFVLDTFFRLIKWNDNDSILDVGVGDGEFAVESLIPRLPKRFQKFVGCDVSQAMLKFAKENYRYSKVDFVHMDIAMGDIPAEYELQFHHIFSFFTLHWVSNQRQAFKNMYKMLKPGGDMLITFLARAPLYDIYQNMAKHIKWKAYTKDEYIGPYHLCKEPEKELENLLIETGFVSHVCRVEKRTYVFPSLEIFKNTIIAVNEIIPHLPSDEVSSYMSDFMQEVRKLGIVTVENNNNSEIVRSQHELFVVFASKPLEI